MARRLLLLAALVAAVAGAFVVSGCGGGSHASGNPPVVTVNRPTETVQNQSSSMEPTLHCAQPGVGCEASAADELVVQPIEASALKRGDIALFNTPPEAAVKCGAGGEFVKRLIGLPGDSVHEDIHGFLDVDGKRLTEPYVSAVRRLADVTDFGKTWRVPSGDYFFVGDNRAESCDSRMWGSVPAADVIGVVVKIVRAR